MGKASKWMINFLLGRKEEKEKKNGVAFLEENGKIPTESLPSTPTIKRRWSFGRSTSKGKAHKSSKSLDLITLNPVVTHALVDLQNQKNNTLALVVASSAPIETVVAPKPTRDGISKALQDAAATKIQAVFRSYLARKALCALRGLVKLQALVRGHIVRKQTTAALRRLHTLMTIQVRARFQRLQMAEESELVVKSRSSRHRHTPQDIGLTRAKNREVIDTNPYETLGISKSKYDYLNHSQIGRIEHGVTTFFSGELSISKREHHYEEFAFSTAQNTPKHNHELSKTIPGRASFTCKKPDYAHPVSHDYSFLPNYMANTESSKAKARSQSEPKQRPKWGMKPKTKRKASMDGNNVLSDTQTVWSPPHSKRVVHGNQEPWFIKLYRSKRFLRDNESDANSSTTSHSNYCNSLMDYEPHVTLY